MEMLKERGWETQVKLHDCSLYLNLAHFYKHRIRYWLYIYGSSGGIDPWGCSYISEFTIRVK